MLVAIDCMSECQRIFHYLVRVLRGTRNCRFVLFHILPTVSPDKLRMDALQRIERLHAGRPDLAGYFWREGDEKKMDRNFAQARETLIEGGFPEDTIVTDFGVESGDLADIILQKAAELGCSTIVLGRRRYGRVKEFLLGSTSGTVLRLARGTSVWVIEN